MIYHALVLLATAVVCISADVAAYTRDAEYDSGVYGAYPVKTYISTDIVSPRPNYLQRHTACDNGQYTLMTPRGNHVPKPGAMILDGYGNLVWWVGGYNQVYNLMAQEYNGAKYLTFWAGDDTVGGHGAGYYYMVAAPIYLLASLTYDLTRWRSSIPHTKKFTSLAQLIVLMVTCTSSYSQKKAPR